MDIHTIVSTLFEENCYLVRQGNECIIIDPGQGTEKRIVQYLQQHNLCPVAILLTHGHLDHTWDAHSLSSRYQISTYIHSLDRPQLSNPKSGIPAPLSFLLSGMKFQEPESVYEVDNISLLSLGDWPVQVLAVPGHTSGSVSYLIEDAVFTGDSLFDMSIGRSDLPGGNHLQLISAIKSQLLSLPDDYRVFSGHGPETTIGQQRKNNPFLV